MKKSNVLMIFIRIFDGNIKWVNWKEWTMNKKVVSQVFGELHLDECGGFYDQIIGNDMAKTPLILSISKEIKEAAMIFELSILLDNYIELDKQALSFILKNLNEIDSTSKSYYDFHREELASPVSKLLNSNNVSYEYFVCHTKLTALSFNLEEGELKATFDYKLLEKDSNEILAIVFTTDEKIVSLSHEN